VDFRKHKIGFREADRRYAELKRQRDAETIGDEEFEARRQQLRVQDDEGRWWAKFGESGEWHYRDGVTWVRGTPPGYQEATAEPPTDGSLAQAPFPPRRQGTENEKNRRKRLPLWIPVAGLGGIALVGIVLIVWVLVPYLQGEQGAISVNQGRPAPNGTAFDAVFVHHATSENISTNSTYLDNPLTNDNPNIILYVTQNWNPGGAAGTYNDHNIGVWYDPSRQRWAIFNQDREAMTEGAAFNVAVLEEPTEAS
jgi:hypothetical protein